MNFAGPTRSAAPLAAVTGATGFIGCHLVRALMHAGWRVRLLSRRAPRMDTWCGFCPEVVPGTLGDDGALERLVADADAVIHAAGLIKSARRREFFEVNCTGSARLAAITRRLAPHAPLAQRT